MLAMSRRVPILVLLLLTGCTIYQRPDSRLDEREYALLQTTDHFDIYVEAEIHGLDEPIGEWMEEIYEKVGSLFQAFPQERMAVKIYSTPLPTRDGTLEFYGYAGERTIYSKMYPDTRRNLAHEYTHVIAAHVARAPISDWFNEGLATFVSNHLEDPLTPSFEDEIFHFTHEDFLHFHSLSGTRSILKLPERSSAIREKYAYRSSFISYLVEEHGFGVILDILRRIDPDVRVEDTFPDVLGLSFEEVDRGWEAFLRSHADPALYEKYGLIRDWHVIGPFDNSRGMGFHLDHVSEVDLNATCEAIQQEVRWREIRSNHPVGIVNLRECEFSPSQEVLAYAVTFIDLHEERDLVIQAGADDTLTLWLNGERLIHRQERRGFRPDQHAVPATFRKGRNEILVKVCQARGAWVFSVRVLDGETPVR
jgi:hypothetical protein